MNCTNAYQSYQRYNCFFNKKSSFSWIFNDFFYYSKFPISRNRNYFQFPFCFYFSSDAKDKINSSDKAYINKKKVNVNSLSDVTLSNSCPNEPLNIKSLSQNLREKESLRKPIHINEDDLLEKFIKGGGPGGQKINKSSSTVYLKHLPTGIEIKCQKTPSLLNNRKEARKMLIKKLDDLINGPCSKGSIKAAKLKERKRQKEKKHRKKAKEKMINDEDSFLI